METAIRKTYEKCRNSLQTANFAQKLFFLIIHLRHWGILYIVNRYAYYTRNVMSFKCWFFLLNLKCM